MSSDCENAATNLRILALEKDRARFKREAVNLREELEMVDGWWKEADRTLRRLCQLVESGATVNEVRGVLVEYMGGDYVYWAGGDDE